MSVCDHGAEGVGYKSRRGVVAEDQVAAAAGGVADDFAQGPHSIWGPAFGCRGRQRWQCVAAKGEVAAAEGVAGDVAQLRNCRAQTARTRGQNVSPTSQCPKVNRLAMLLTMVCSPKPRGPSPQPHLLPHVVVGAVQQVHQDGHRVVLNHHARVLRGARRDVGQRPGGLKL